MNRVKTGIVSKTLDYLHSNAGNCLKNHSLIPEMLPSNPIINPLLKSEYDNDTEL